MNSFKFLTGRSALTTYRLGTLASSEIGWKSLLVSNGSLSKINGLTAKVPMCPKMSVCPSVLCAHSAMAMLPLAPGLFSTNTVWPRLLLISLAADRATISELPPGAKGTSRRMGLLGHAVWAMAGTIAGKALAAASMVTVFRAARRVIGSDERMGYF